MWRAIACGWLIAEKRGMKKNSFLFFFRVPEKGSQGKSFIIFTWPTGRPCLQKKESLLLFFSTFILSPPPRFPEKSGINIFFFLFFTVFCLGKSKTSLPSLSLHMLCGGGKMCVPFSPAARYFPHLGICKFCFPSLPFPYISRVPLPLPFLPLRKHSYFPEREKEKFGKKCGSHLLFYEIYRPSLREDERSQNHLITPWLQPGGKRGWEKGR